MKLLSPAQDNTKLRKSETAEFTVVGLSLPSHTIGMSKGEGSACPESIASCRAACVVSQAGLVAVFPRIQESRIRKREYLFKDRKGFVAQLKTELTVEAIKAEREGKRLIARLNVGSDYAWESSEYGEIPQSTPQVLFYDYTRRHARVGNTPDSYTLVASWDESPRHQRTALELLSRGFNVSVAFADITPLASDGAKNGFTGPRALRQRLPKTWVLPGSDVRWNCHDGDRSDIRLPIAGDPKKDRKTGQGSLICLRIKAFSHDIRSAAIESGFCQLVDWTGKQ